MLDAAPLATDHRPQTHKPQTTVYRSCFSRLGSLSCLALLTSLSCCLNQCRCIEPLTPLPCVRGCTMAAAGLDLGG